MSNRIITSEGRALLPHEIAYVDKMASLLANESGLEFDWIHKILVQTFPTHGIGIFPSSKIKNAHSFMSGKFPGRFLYCFKPCLIEAMRWLDKDQITELFSGDLQFLNLLENQFSSVTTEIPFVKFSELLPSAKKFRDYLEDEFETIIETGSTSPHRRFENYYLESTFLQCFQYRRRILKKTTKESYKEKHKKFPDGLLSEKFLEQLTGPDYYREYGEISSALNYLDPKMSEPKNSIKWQHSLGPLENYLTTNKLKVPANLKKRDELLRSSLYKFAIDSLDAFIESYRNHEPGTILRKIWVLIRSMPYEQLDLLFNGNLSYFGIVGHRHDDPSLYTFGRTLIEKILVAAAIDDFATKSTSIKEVRNALEDLVEEFLDQSTGELLPITYSVYQAIYLCNYKSVTFACAELETAKSKLSNLRETIKKGTDHSLKLSFEKLEDLRRDAIRLEYLSSLGIEDRIAVEKSMDLEQPEITKGYFTSGYEEYHSKNSDYPVFKFGKGLKSKAIKRLHQAYKSTRRGVTAAELISALYVESRAKELSKRSKNPWNLFNDVFDREHPAVIYGFIRRGEQIKGSNTYILDFSFEDRNPQEQVESLKAKKQKRNIQTQTKSEKSKSAHPWAKPITNKSKLSKSKKPTRNVSRMLDRYPDDGDTDS